MTNESRHSFESRFTEKLADQLAAWKGKAHEKALEDLNWLVKAADKMLGDATGSRIGLGLKKLPAAANELGFSYELSLVNAERRAIKKLFNLSFDKTGAYPVMVYMQPIVSGAATAVQFLLGDRASLEELVLSLLNAPKGPFMQEFFKAREAAEAEKRAAEVEAAARDQEFFKQKGAPKDA